MDEVDRAMSSAYSAAVSGLSQLYHLGQSQQMLAFRAGERHSLHEIDSVGVNSTRMTTQHQQTRMSTSMSMASSVTPVQCGAERNNNRMFPTAPSRFSRGEQQPSLIQRGRYYHGDGSRFNSASNEETMEPHIAQPRNSETQGQEWAMDLNVYDPQFNWKHG